MKLYAISDLHLNKQINQEKLAQLPPHPDDWLIVAGDVGHNDSQFHFAWTVLTQRFAKVIWTPGNHDLWTIPGGADNLYGEEKYQHLVAMCRNYGVLTPEDPYVRWTGEGPICLLAPLFTLYDYTFRPDDVPAERALAWAEETNVICNDEFLLHPNPYVTRTAWCQARCRNTEPRLVEAAAQGPLILINHYPLRRDLAILPLIPRFSLWCGTRRTEDWHTRFGALAVVYGHLHIRSTHFRDNVRFEEVSLGYPQNWNQQRSIKDYLRQILPVP